MPNPNLKEKEQKQLNPRLVTDKNTSTNAVAPAAASATGMTTSGVSRPATTTNKTTGNKGGTATSAVISAGGPNTATSPVIKGGTVTQRSAGTGTATTQAAATPAMKDVAANNLISAQSVNGALPEYQFTQGGDIQFNYDGQLPEFGYQQGNSPQFNYNGQGATFQNAGADPQLQMQYQNAMAALEQMKGKAPTYGRQYDAQIQDLYNQIVGRDKFTYDSKTDPLYQQYAQDYTMQGKMAMRDTMGKAAGLTGGYGSSYSQAVGQQMYDQYLQRMADVLPETYNMALNAYNAEGDRLAQNMALTQDLEKSDYNRYLDKLNQYNIDVNRAQNDADTAYDRMIAADERAYGRAVDQYNRDLTADQLAYSRALDDYNRQLAADDTAYNRATDAYNRQLTADQLAYNRATDAYDRSVDADQRAYNRQVDEYNRLLNENKIAYDRSMDAIDMQADVDKYNRNTQDAYYDRLISLMGIGYNPTAQDYANAGLTVAQGQAIRNNYLASIKPTGGGTVTKPKEEETTAGTTGTTNYSANDLVTKYKSLSGSEKTQFDQDVRSAIASGALDIDLATWKYIKGQ